MTAVPAAPIPPQLARARQALDQAHNVDELRELRDLGELWVQAARRRGGLQVQNAGAELKLRAERRLGQLLTDTPMFGRRDVSRDATRLPDGVTRSQSSRWQQAAQLPDHLFEAHLAEVVNAGGELTTAGVLRATMTHRQPQRPISPATPTGRFEIVLADPPWRYPRPPDARIAAERFYPTMTDEDLAALPIPAADSALLFLWAPPAILHRALQLTVTWGFEYRTNLVWAKTQPGTGFYLRNRHEHLLIARRGDMPVPEPPDRPPSVLHAPRGQHSAKPPEARKLIERMYPGRTRVELFARHPAPGWVSWGNEITVGGARAQAKRRCRAGLTPDGPVV